MDVSHDLIPRPELVEALVADASRVVLVAGVSGAGKSQLLREAVEVVRLDRTVAGPREVMWSSPVLQLMLDGLADIVADRVQQKGVAERVGARLSGVMERLIASNGREIAVAAGKEILSLIRARVSPEAGQAVADAFKALQEESGESLGSRLDRARSETALEVIVGFASEVAAVSDGRPALVVLDRCERLNDAGVRLLADLAEVLPNGVQIWAGVRDDTDLGQFLLRTDASSVAIPPLSTVTIAEILDRRGLSPGAAEDISRRTAGTALDVEAVVGLLGRGDTRELDSIETLAQDTAQRVELVSSFARGVVLRLAALSDPLPEQYLLRFTNGERDQFRAVMKELADAGLLTAHGPRQWIHERRREALLTNMPQDLVGPAVEDAAAAVWDYVQAGGEEQWLVELADLARREPELAKDDETLRPVLDLPAGALGVLAALIELTEPSSPVVKGQALLNYARSTYPGDERELEHLEALGEAGIVETVANNHAAVSILRLSGLSLAVGAGRIGREFGRMPVPAISSVAFRGAILPRIEPFIDGHMGLGRPALRALSYMAIGRRENAWTPVPQVERRDARPAMITRAAFAGRPLYGVFAFQSADRRDRAIDALTGLDVEFLDDRVTVSAALAHPMTAVPVDRFLRAAERVVGKSIQTNLQGIEQRLEKPLSYAEFAELRVSTAKQLRDLAGATLRGAMELDLPLSLHWVAREHYHLEIEVHGGRAIAAAHENLPQAALAQGPYRLFHLAQALHLRPEESITMVNHRAFAHDSHAPTNFDPVLAEIGRRRTVTGAFNKAQRPVPIRFDESLPSLIRDAFFREMQDARILAAALPFLGREEWEIPAVARYVVLPIEPLDPGSHLVPGADSVLVWAEMPSTSGRDECHVIYEGFVNDGLSAPDEALANLPGYDEASVQRSGQAVTTGGVAHLLGHREEDLDFLAGLREQ